MKALPLERMEMKNFAALAFAVAVASVAVFAASRFMRAKSPAKGSRLVKAVAASRPILPGKGAIEAEWLKPRLVDVDSLPVTAIPWQERNRVLGQTPSRTIPEGDYVLLGDIAGAEIILSGTVPEGEWAVPVSFADSSLARFLQPGDEIAILASASVRETVESLDATEAAAERREDSTSVLFPCVRILDIGEGDGIRRDGGRAKAVTVIVALSPREAATLVAAERLMDLYPALRRSGDASSMKRRDVGVVDESTFRSLRSGLAPVDLGEGGR